MKKIKEYVVQSPKTIHWANFTIFFQLYLKMQTFNESEWFNNVELEFVHTIVKAEMLKIDMCF